MPLKISTDEADEPITVACGEGITTVGAADRIPGAARTTGRMTQMIFKTFIVVYQIIRNLMEYSAWHLSRFRGAYAL